MLLPRQIMLTATVVVGVVSAADSHTMLLSADLQVYRSMSNYINLIIHTILQIMNVEH